MEEIQVDGMRFSLDPSRPLYEQVLSQVRSSIAKGEISLGAKMPSVRDMAEGLKINPNTVMRAYKELERDGLTESHGSQGTYITINQETVDVVRQNLAHEAIDAFLKSMQSLGFDWTDIDTLLRERGRLEG